MGPIDAGRPFYPPPSRPGLVAAIALEIDPTFAAIRACVARQAAMLYTAGAGADALYVVPSLDLVVCKLGGRDDQYSPANTGIEPHLDATRTASDRDGWKQTVAAETAARRTLQLVIEAVKG